MLYDLKKYGVSAPYVYNNVTSLYQIVGNDYQYLYLYNRNLVFPNNENIYNYKIGDINKIIDIKIKSDYLIEKKINGNHVYLKFKNVDSQGLTLNYYFIEFILEIKNNDVVNLTDFIMYSDKKVDGFTYNLKAFNIDENSSEKNLSYLAVIETQEQANIKESDLIKYESLKKLGVKYLIFENLIYWGVYNFNSPNNSQISKTITNNEQNLFTINVIGSIKSDIIEVNIKKKNFYRQGLLFKKNNFISLFNLQKHLFIGNKQVKDELIDDSQEINKGNVRIKNNLNWKQAKYIESDN